MDTSVRSSCSSVVSNTVANDAAQELWRIQALLAARGVPSSFPPNSNGANRSQAPMISPKRKAQPPRHQPASQSLKATHRSLNNPVSVSLLSSNTSSSARVRTASTNTRRLQSKIQATLRSSKEMQALLSRQYDLLEEANRQLKTLGLQERHRL